MEVNHLQKLIVSWFGANDFEGRIITDLSAANDALAKDEDGYILNGLISFATSINAINHESYSWAFVSNYYAFFYFAKALLARNKFEIIYSCRKPFSVRVEYANCINKEKEPNSHKLVYKKYVEEFNGNLILCGDVAGQKITDWYTDRRNSVNYRFTPMTDPEPPFAIYKYNGDLRMWLLQYLNEPLYAYDEEHCYVAFVVQLMKICIGEYVNNGKPNRFLKDEQMNFFKQTLKDSKGCYSFIIDELNKIKVS